MSRIKKVERDINTKNKKKNSTSLEKDIKEVLGIGNKETLDYVLEFLYK